MSGKFKFPKNFYWGAATSAHQVEGNNHNDWTEWEKGNAKYKVKNAKFKKWPSHILNPPAGGPNPLQEKNYISGQASDHYNRFHEDFDIAKSLSLNAYRFSIEWSRIEPEEGEFNEQEIIHYKEVVKALQDRGIEPFITLWHVTLPRWFTRRGGWLHNEAEKTFLRFTKRIINEFKNDVSFWIIYNEPETFSRHGYFIGDRPPQEKNFIKSYRVLKELSQIYVKTYRLIKKLAPQLQVGFSEGLVYFEPYNKLPHNVLMMKFIERWRNNPFLERFINNSDFIGLQYYFHSRIRFNPFVSKWGFQFNENKNVNDLRWEIYPEGIYQILKDLKRYNKPIYITENGLADAQDTKRAAFIKDHLKWVNLAIQEGVNVKGYFHWSLLDNFEWNEGFWPRFGLTEIDYKTMERRIRPSAHAYRKIIQELTKN